MNMETIDTKKELDEYLAKLGEDSFSSTSFIAFVWEQVNNRPKEWRQGQAVFNYIDMYFGVARDVQFLDGLDCFYNDSLSQCFIELAWERWWPIHFAEKGLIKINSDGQKA